MRRVLISSMTLLALLQPAMAAESTDPISLEEGTSVRLRLEEAVSSKTSTAGEKLKLTVIEDVVAKDGMTVVIKEGTNAVGYLMNLDEKEGSKGGKVSIEVSSVKAIDGTRIALRGVKSKSGSGGAGVGSYLAGGLLFGVVGLGAVALAGRSHNAKIPAGTLITSFVDRDAKVEAVVVPTVTVIRHEEAASKAALADSQVDAIKAEENH